MIFPLSHTYSFPLHCHNPTPLFQPQHNTTTFNPTLTHILTKGCHEDSSKTTTNAQATIAVSFTFYVFQFLSTPFCLGLLHSLGPSTNNPTSPNMILSLVLGLCEKSFPMLPGMLAKTMVSSTCFLFFNSTYPHFCCLANGLQLQTYLSAHKGLPT